MSDRPTDRQVDRKSQTDRHEKIILTERQQTQHLQTVANTSYYCCNLTAKILLLTARGAWFIMQGLAVMCNLLSELLPPQTSLM